MLSIPIDDMGEVTVLNPELIPDDVDGKFSRLDIKAEIQGAFVNIEMTIAKFTAYHKRVMYYWAAIYHGQLEKGKSYETLKKTISLNILAYKAYDHNDYHSEFVLYDQKHDTTIDDVLEIHFFELPKIMSDPSTDGEKRQNMWLETIDANSGEEMQAVCSKYNNGYVDKCAKVVTAMNADTAFRERIRSREDGIRDYEARLYDARQEGIVDSLISSIVNVMSSFNVGIEQAMKSLHIPESDYPKYKDLVSKRGNV